MTLPMRPEKEWTKLKEILFTTLRFDYLILSSFANIRFKNLSFLKSLHRLKKLYLEYPGAVINITGIDKLDMLEDISLSFKKLTGNYSFEQMTSLRKAWTDNNPGVETLFLNQSIEELTLVGGEVRDLLLVSQMRSLRKIKLYGCKKFESLKGYDLLPNLVEVELEDCPNLRDISEYSNLDRDCKVFIDGKKLYRQRDLDADEMEYVINKFGKDRVDIYF